MCYLARHQQSPVVDTTEPAESPSSPGPRPRWAAAAAAAILAGVAAAALLDRPASQAASTEQAPAGIHDPVTSTLVPMTSTADRSPITPDDGVPTSAETSKAALGGCHHGA